ncbi:cation diffusion facilitator family transporter [Pontibacter mangrovi]|uniref:Cation diffusion facilitator family transporter n=1 Tax=Pontibacter mangrovi TaxID=2589816 RepID=A0A501VX99_9BACT|nr:cation diffusion facilitator family transporter [Pontibacter mangrovi]TPE41035.1 cation diffusion facilitator family transporter [Pontibacter mangrovi]
MKQIDNFEYPQGLRDDFKKAKKLEWITIGYLITTALAMYLTMGNSQAMKTAWFEDLLSLTPSVSFLIASRIFFKSPNRDFPFGYHRVVSIAYLCSALALFSIGTFLVIDSVITLAMREHATIGTVVVLGHQVWLGYLMIAALLWGTFPAIILGKKKLPIAEKLHEKNLYTDAKMNKADWMTAAAAIFGVLGIGMGWWWADSVAALVISVDIVHDGFNNLRQAVYDLMDQVPMTVDNQKRDPLIEKVKETLAGQSWVKDCNIRLREEGHIYLGEGFVIPAREDNLTQLIEEASREVRQLDWRIQEFVIMPVEKLPKEEKA